MGYDRAFNVICQIVAGTFWVTVLTVFFAASIKALS